MANPTKVSSYPPRMVLMQQTLADSDEHMETYVEFSTQSAQTTFISRFYSLRQLLVNEARESRDSDQGRELAARLGSLSIKKLGQTDAGTFRIQVSNYNNQLQQVTIDSIDRALEDLMAKKMARMQAVEPTPEPHPQPTPQPASKGADDDDDFDASAVPGYSTRK